MLLDFADLGGTNRRMTIDPYYWDIIVASKCIFMMCRLRWYCLAFLWYGSTVRI